MTDYEEEQRSEIEALESIYPDEFNIIQTTPLQAFTVSIKTPDFDDGEEGAYCLISFTYVAKYPDEPPVIEIIDTVNVEDNITEELTTYLINLADENLGMAMVFTLVSSSQEWLALKTEELKLKKEEEKERRLKDVEEAERKKFEGTRVTVESFLSWKVIFDSEMSALRNKQSKDDSGPKRLTGREMFQKDHTLNESDIQFLQEGEEEVKVDESLFQDLEDLDIEEIPDGDESN